MKITDFIIVFVIIFSSVFFYNQVISEKTSDFTELNHHNNLAMKNAVQDSVEILRTNIDPILEVGYESYKINPTSPQLAYDTFIKTLSLNYLVQDENTLRVLEHYIPLFAVMDYDGLYLNVYKQYMNTNNEEMFERVWLPKVPFTYKDAEGNIINFTVDDHVEVYDKDLNEWYEDRRAVLASDNEITVPLLKDEANFDNIRRSTIVNILQENFAYYINEHNVYRKKLGITYKFTLPLISQEDWYNTVDDVGVFAFLQGYTYWFDNTEFNEYAFSGSRLHKVDRIFGGVVDGIKRFWSESCNYSFTVDEIFNSKKMAAANGYSEMSCLNPGVN